MINKLKNCFSYEKLNTGRQLELDLAKGFAIIFMVWVHMQEGLLSNNDGFMASLVKNILGGPFAAPIFMICMGIGINYSRRNTPKDLLRRGVTLLGIGYVLNLIRYVLPLSLVSFSTNENEIALGLLTAFFGVDILQFAGLAFLFMALVKKLNLKSTTVFLIGIGTSLIGMSLRWLSTDNDIADLFLGYFWATNSDTYFPFFNWIIFLIVGNIMGVYFQKCKDKQTFYSIVSPVCGIIGLTYLFTALHFGIGMYAPDSSYYFLGIVDVFFVVMLAIGIFGFNYALLKKFSNYDFKPFMRMSRNINTVYCIHWSLLPWFVVLLYWGFGIDNFSFWQVAACAFILLIVSDKLAEWYIKVLKPKFARYKSEY
ncbi:hypothetical protein C2I18_22855 [Paenibacillus sp. PK3_47]|uniref:acyltransferase family protein n=1 Tax=Paenibacillus sp. PK3_47 TaxID=2072642 RepID=UPI00201E175D|nr:acyltransferase family protein [Paenibacillus sp. PK3_47]UQZ36117.1 hypothetical protein C2I18_22855 [Paenibacillus sp. PK3_47]